MKSALGVSVLANLALAGAVLWLTRHPGVASRPIPVEGPKPEVASAAPAPASTAKPADNATLRWSDIESPNYRVYIANLRRIGCPEQTIRELIVADVDDLYNARRADTRRRLSSGNQEGLEVALQRLEQEESGVIAALLDLKPAPTPAVAEGADQNPLQATPTPLTREGIMQRQREAKESAPAVLPLALQPVDFQAFHLSDEQIAAINELRQDFNLELGGANQDPGDPDYLRRWRAAQQRSDALMATVLGPLQAETLRLNQAAQAPQ